MNTASTWKRGIFILSLDTELAWGWMGNKRLQQLSPQLEEVRPIAHRLLRLLEKYQAPATWAVVGKLFARPQPSAEPLEENGRLKAAGDIIDAILDSPLAHEIASHSFSHPLYDRITRAEAEADLQEAVRAAAEWGLKLRSFIFPSNRVGHLEALPRFGFIAFRGPDRAWFAGYPRMARQILNRADQALALTPSLSLPEVKGDRLVNLPAGMHFRIPSWGASKRLPASLLASKAVKGIKRAIRERAVFHIWFHPFNFGYRAEAHFAALEKTLQFAAQCRDQRLIDLSTMEALAARILEGRKPKSPLRNARLESVCTPIHPLDDSFSDG